MGLAPSPGVVRAGTILATLADAAAHGRTSMSTSELARVTQIPRATCDSILLGLRASGLVRRHRDLGYGLGLGCITLGDAARAVNTTLARAAGEAEALARELGAVVAVTVRYGTETRVVDVYDFGPQIGNRVRGLESMELIPPFGASFVAWDETAIEEWLARACPPLGTAEMQEHRRVLAAVRQRGYSVTIGSEHQQGLAHAMERLARGDAAATRERDVAMRELRGDQYLVGLLDPAATVRLIQISAPVFEPDGEVDVSLMILGPGRDVTGAEIDALGRRLLEATRRLDGR